MDYLHRRRETVGSVGNRGACDGDRRGDTFVLKVHRVPEIMTGSLSDDKAENPAEKVSNL